MIFVILCDLLWGDTDFKVLFDRTNSLVYSWVQGYMERNLAEYPEWHVKNLALWTALKNIKDQKLNYLKFT